MAKVFRSQCLLPVTETYLQMAAGVVQGQYLSPRTINLMLAGLSDALAYKESYLVMKPHMEALMIQLAFPLMCFNDDDKELWEEDPAEYIRKGYDAIEELYSEKNAAISFMVGQAGAGRLRRCVSFTSFPSHPRFLHSPIVLTPLLTDRGCGEEARDKAGQEEGEGKERG